MMKKKFHPIEQFEQFTLNYFSGFSLLKMINQLALFTSLAILWSLSNVSVIKSAAAAEKNVIKTIGK